ncbi:MAG: CDP-alcohol phosphatidyltransferase family protein [Acidimicrobiales bacterium]
MQSRTFGPSALATPANGLTAARLLVTPIVVVAVLARGPSWALLGAWVVLASTDGLDGWVARRQGATRSGAFLDPLADKFLVLGALAALAGRGVLPWIPVAIIALREVGMSVYRSLAGRRGRSVPASALAKAKTWAQDLTVGVALAPIALPGDHVAALALLWLAVVLTLLSGAQYGLARR